MTKEYRLKTEIPVAVFLKKVRECRDEVVFRTAEGDLLNLKSVLTQYVFCLAMETPGAVEKGRIFLEPGDADMIREYLI